MKPKHIRCRLWERGGGRQALRPMLLAACLLCLASAVVLAQAGGGYDLTWNTVDDGGALSTGATYTLQGTAGQSDAGVMQSGGLWLAGGFWPGGAAPTFVKGVYLPVVLRNQ